MTIHNQPQFDRISAPQNIDLPPDAKLATEINHMHREVQRLGRTAKKIAAEIGKNLIEVKQQLAHGQFKPWVSENCMFSYRTAADYMTVAKANRTSVKSDFEVNRKMRSIWRVSFT